VEGESNSRSTAVGNTTTIAIESDDETIIKSALNLIPYFTRIKEVDRVGFEPTTAANQHVFYFIVQSVLYE
jgi:hypothetical protein